jgi:hypothetical protein
VIQADAGDRVLHMVHEVGHACLRHAIGARRLEEGGDGGDLRDAAHLADHVQLFVIQVARMGAEGGASGVGHRNRHAGEFGRLHHPGLRDMRAIKHQPDPVHLGDGGAAERREAAMLGFGIMQVAAGAGAVGERVVPVMRQRQVDGAQTPPSGDARKVMPHGIAVLDGREHGGDAGGETRFHLVRRRAEAGGHPIGASADVAQHRLGAGAGRRMAGVVAGTLADIGDEDRGTHAATAHLGQVHALRGLAQPIRRLGPADVDMGVDDERGHAASPKPVRKRCSSVPRISTL